MRPNARIAAAIEILEDISSGCAAEPALTSWARAHRFAGSGDRAAIRDIVFDVLRRRRSCAHIGGAENGRAMVIGYLRQSGSDPAEVFTGEGFAPPPLTDEEVIASSGVPNSGFSDAIALDVPDWSLPLFRDSLGQQTEEILNVMRDRAPLFLRVNLRKATVEQVVHSLAENGVEVRRHPLSDTALLCASHPRGLANSAAFRQGWFEMQDAASQAVVDMIDARARSKVLDLCAGGGGKSLALAGRVDANFYAHDAAPERMKDLQPRAQRADAEVKQLLSDNEVGKNSPYDIVICDVPCSGSGAWRRSPEAKWSMSPSRLADLQRVQAQILERAARLTSQSGKVVYVTCSLFKTENHEQIANFLRKNAGWVLEAERLLTPLDGGDGFYTARLKRQNG